MGGCRPQKPATIAAGTAASTVIAFEAASTLDTPFFVRTVRNQMRSHAVFIVIAAAIASNFALIGCRRGVAVSQVDPNGPVEVAIPEHGAYTGAFMDFGDAEDDVTLETIEEFEQMVGKHQAIIASSSYWGEQNFPVDNLNVIWRHGSLPLVFWSPWDRPYEEDHGPDKFSLTAIISGRWDAYIDKWGDAARNFGHPMIVVFGVEMNGTWFPWSGPKHFAKHFATSWIGYGRAALQISSGCFIRTIILIRTKPGIARPLTIRDRITSIGSA